MIRPAALCASLLLAAAAAPDAGIVTTGPEVRSFLGGRTGKVVYLKNYFTQVYFLDFSDSALVEHRLSADEQCLSPMIHPDGDRVLYEHNSTIWIRDLVPNSPTRIQVYTRPWKLGQTMEPRWWVDPTDSTSYVLFNTGNIEDHEWTPASGATYLVKLDRKTFQPVGEPTQLIPFMMSGGRSRDGAWGATSHHSTGMYRLAPGKVQNAFQASANWMPLGAALLACNASISPSRVPARMDRMLHLHSGMHGMGGKPYDNHKAVIMRSWGDKDVALPLWWMGPLGDRVDDDGSGNLYWEAPEWSNDEDYFTVTGSKEADIPEGAGDLYVVKINMEGNSRLLRIFDGGATDFYGHLWIKDGIAPARIRLDQASLAFAAYRKDTADPAPRKVTVRNAGDVRLPALALGPLPKWLQVEITGNGTDSVTLVNRVFRDSAGLGEHRAKVAVTYGGGVDSAAYEVVFRHSDPVLTTLAPPRLRPVVAVGDTLRLAAAGLDQAGRPLPEQPVVAWGGPGPLIPDASGLFTADSVPWRTYPVIGKSGAVACTVNVIVARRLLRVDAGADPAKVPAGWMADTGIAFGGSAGRVPDSVGIAPVPDGAPGEAARTFRQGSSAWFFRSLPNGRYKVRVHLVAGPATAKAPLSFKLEGSKVLEEYVLPEAADSALRRADMRELAVTVADGNGLSLEVSGTTGAAALAAVEVYDAGITPVALVSPNGGESFAVGDTLRIRWETDENLITSCGVSLSVDSGATWLPLTRTRSVGLGDADWEAFAYRLPDSLDGVGLVTTRALVSVYDYFGTDRDRSDRAFAIVPRGHVALRRAARPAGPAAAALPGGRLRVDLAGRSGAFTAEVADLGGRRLRAFALAGGRTHVLDLAGLPPGAHRLLLRGPGTATSLLLPPWP